MVRLRPNLELLFELLCALSIPLWCDCDALLSQLTRMHLELLSIPLWCDCDGFGLLSVCCLFGLFQSHYGAIATKQFWVVDVADIDGFNPTMVRLRLLKNGGEAHE